MVGTVKNQTGRRARKTALLFGVGYTARALIPHLSARGYTIIGTSRSDEKAKLLSAALGIQMVVFDGSGTQGLKRALTKAHIILSSIPPDPSGDPVIRALGPILGAAAPCCKWAGYLSATSVYGDRDGQWTFEDEPLRPVTRRGKYRMQAEMNWLESGLPVHVFRLAGIYGPEISGISRSPFDRLRTGNARAVIKPGHVVNRIFVTDIADAIMASIDRPNPVYIYNLSDGAPSPPQDVINHAAGLLGLPHPPQVPYDTAKISNMSRSFYKANKRVSNDRARHELGWEPTYPNFQAGLQAIFKSEGISS